MDRKITCADAVMALKKLGRSVPATEISRELGTTPRAVATALRRACSDGRVSIRYGAARSYPGARLQVALYRFRRMNPKPMEGA